MNEFAIGDIVEIKLGDDWFRFWNSPIRDREDQEMAKELVESGGGSLGTYSASFAARGTMDSFRTRKATPEELAYKAPEIVGDHFHNTVTGKPIGPRG